MVTNVLFTLCLSVAFVCYVVYVTTFLRKLSASLCESLGVLCYAFVYKFLCDILGVFAGSFFGHVFSLFLFILSLNLLGLIPHCFAVSAQFAVTFTVGFIGIFGLNYVGLRLHGLHFFSFFLPKGAPLALAPFLVLIELVSYFFRLFSLTIRLFANMFAGHTLLTILSGFSLLLLPSPLVCVTPWLVSSAPMFVVFAVLALELSISFLQAYVFSILFCLYLTDSVYLH